MLEIVVDNNRLKSCSDDLLFFKCILILKGGFEKRNLFLSGFSSVRFRGNSLELESFYSLLILCVLLFWMFLINWRFSLEISKFFMKCSCLELCYKFLM